MSENPDAALTKAYEETALPYTVAKSIQVACATIFFYYCALTFGDEKTYIWSRKLSLGKVMYLITRYSGAVFIIYMIVSIHGLPWNGNVDPRLRLGITTPICFYGYLYVGLGVLPVTFAEVILEMRVYALYGRSKCVLALLVVLTLVSLGVSAAQAPGFAYLITNRICIDVFCNPFFRAPSENGITTGISASCASDAFPMSVLGWLTTSLIELVLFAMVLWKARQEKRTQALLGLGSVKDERDIPTMMARDSTMYFAIMFTICGIGTCLAFVAQIQTTYPLPILFISEQLNAYETIVITIASLLAPRMLISLRREYYAYGARGSGLHKPSAIEFGRGTRDRTLTWDARRHTTQRTSPEVSNAEPFEGEPGEVQLSLLSGDGTRLETENTEAAGVSGGNSL